MAVPYDHVGVIGALPEEVERLHEHLDGETIEERAGRRYHHGRLGSQRITLVQSRIGKVAAAVTATTLIREHGVDAIIFTGVAGALDDALSVGDVVVADQLVQHDLQGPPEMFARGEVPLLGVVEIGTDPALAAGAVSAARDFLDSGFRELVAAARTSFDLAVEQPRVHVGEVATGDEFVHGSLKDVVRARAPRALCVDMEGAAVAQVCLEHGGTPLCVIRAISDLAGATASVDFPRFLQALAQHYSYEILRRLFAAP